jgi:hypothetical protein
MSESEFTVNPDSAVYYTGRYWNEYPQVKAYIFGRISGDENVDIFSHFAQRVPRQFERALILNCGNGWVERDLFARGVLAEAVGVDYSDALLAEARSSARTLGLRARYQKMDVNSALFPSDPMDLAVNYAAGHHIAYLDRVFRAVCNILPADGWYFGYDYVGAHRNQYSGEAWDQIGQLNHRMPPHLRQELAYPHLPTMLLTDPTEAIHSELVFEVFRRYFQVVEHVPVGGAIAYPLLTFNERMFSAPDGDEKSMWIQKILEADAQFLDSHPDSALFAYFTGRPLKAVLGDDEQLLRWTEEEDQREADARLNGGEYYPRTSVAAMTIAAEESRVQAAEAVLAKHQLEQRVENLEGELEALRTSVSYRLAMKLTGGRVAGALRRLPVVRPIRQALASWLNRGYV